MAIDAEDRCKQYQTSSPFRDYKLCYSKHFNDRKKAEAKAHSVLKKYAEDYGVKSQNWHFLTDKKSVVYELANSGFSIFAGINPAVAGGFEHQGYFALIDKNGYIRSRVDRFDNPIVYYSGLDREDQDVQGVDMLLEDIERLLKE